MVAKPQTHKFASQIAWIVQPPKSQKKGRCDIFDLFTLTRDDPKQHQSRPICSHQMLYYEGKTYTKFDVSQGSAPDPAGEVTALPQTL